MRVNLNQLRAFFLAAKEESITLAAEALFVTQPAVTMQVKALEHSLGVKLFRKCGKTLELTDAGSALYDYSKKIFEIVGEMEHVLEGYVDLSHGSLTIGTTRSFARHLMPGLISRFQERYPKVKVYLKEGSSEEIAKDILDFKYDLGFVGRLPSPGKLKVVPFSKEEFTLVTSPIHRFANRKKVSLHEMQNEPIIIREKGSGSRYAILSLFESHHVSPSVLVEAGSVEFIKEYVIKGRGISFLYRAEVEMEANLGLLSMVPVEEGPIYIQTDIIIPRDVELSPPAQAFLELLEGGL